MRFIINTTNLQSGGALQIALSLLEEWNVIGNKNDFHVFLSPQLEQLLDQNKFEKNFLFYTFIENPTSRILRTFIYHKKLKQLEANIKPNAVFTIFGPAIWKPKNPHLVGFANGYYLYDNSTFIQENICTNFIKKLKYYGRRLLLLNQLNREANFYWTETEVTKEKICNDLKIQSEKVAVIGNTFGTSFNFEKSSKPIAKSTFELIYVSAYYLHKNFEIIPSVIEILEQKKIKCRFVLTLPPEKFETLFSKQKSTTYLKNLGVISPFNLAKIYCEADAVFMPSLLETFSANYPEAMKMELPIMCSDFDFSRNICGDAAFYFDAQNPKDIAEKIIELIENKGLQKQLVDAGKKRLQQLETPESRAKKLLELLIKTSLTYNNNYQ